MGCPNPARTLFLAAIFASGAAFAAAQVARFTWAPASPTTATPVNFIDMSEPSPISWTWDFGDPTSGAANSSTEQDPSHTYTAPGQYTVTLTVSGGSVAQGIIDVAPAGGNACDSSTLLCLVGGRFQVTVTWTKPDGTSGFGVRVPLTDESGYFWFFDPNNIEMVVKVLNGCGLNDAFWVFAAGLTNVKVTWIVTDTLTGATFIAFNSQGVAFAPVQETQAFPGSCP